MLFLLSNLMGKSIPKANSVEGQSFPMPREVLLASRWLKVKYFRTCRFLKVQKYGRLEDDFCETKEKVEGLDLFFLPAAILRKILLLKLVFA